MRGTVLWWIAGVAFAGVIGVLVWGISVSASPVAWTMAVGTWATVLVLVATLYFVSQQVNEATKLRREQTRPYVVVFIDVEQRSLFMLAVENVGSTPAFNVAIKFDQPPQSRITDFRQVRMLQEPIPMLPPGHKFRVTWDGAHEVLDESYPYPLSYRATAEYQDHKGRECGPDPYVLDFRVYGEQAQNLKGTHELVTAIENLHKEHAKWTNGIRGLLVHNVDAVKETRRQQRPRYLGKVKCLYRDKGWRAAASYWTGMLQRRYGLWLR